MAEVYWIRLPEHTDMLSEGYIGYTKHTAEQRFYNHKKDAEGARNGSVIGRALRKYGVDGVILETIVVCSPEYAVWLENKLRPTGGIGWNISAGGEYPSKDRVVSLETRRKLSEAAKGRKLPQESIEKTNRGRFYHHMKKNVETYSIADSLYQMFLEGTTYYYAEKGLGRKYGSLQRIFQHFAKGWVPIEDEVWRDTYLTNDKEASNGS